MRVRSEYHEILDRFHDRQTNIKTLYNNVSHLNNNATEKDIQRWEPWDVNRVYTAMLSPSIISMNTL